MDDDDVEKLPPMPEKPDWPNRWKIKSKGKANPPSPKPTPDIVLDSEAPPPPPPPQYEFVPFPVLELPPAPRLDGEPLDRPRLTPRQVEHARALIQEAQKRSIEALRLYEPLPTQLAFHQSMSRQRIARGSNRSTKTTCAIVELAMALTGQHWQPGKYPLTNGRAIVVAKDEDKIGEVIWRKLGRAGAFQICNDPSTGRWRAYRPWLDEALGLKPKPAPPLLPPRLIKDIAWALKKTSIPRKVIVKNGWECTFYSSKSDPFTIQGTDLDVVMFDEEIVHASWYAEAISRLIDRSGWFWWSATPQTGTQQLYDLHLRAEAWQEDVAADRAKAKEVPPVTEVFMSIFDNPHLPAKARNEWIDSLDDDERRVRVDGEFAITGLKVYEAHFFPRGIHGVEPFPIPTSWTRFAAIDPGAQVAAVLFVACPPLVAPSQPEVDSSLYGDFMYFYDELYLRQCDARKLAERMRMKIGSQEIYEFIIDHHGGRLTEIGSGKTPEQQYREAFRAEGVKSIKTGSSFTWGSDDLDGGILRVKEFLRVRDDGTSKIRVFRGTCQNMIQEMVRYQWKVVNGEVTDKPVKRRDHMPDDVRYLCMHRGVKYVKPKATEHRSPSALDAFKALQKRQKARRHQGSEPGITLG